MTAAERPADGAAPLVSIIIPTYNWSSVLRFAIQSVLWQTLRDFEVLVMGDGCTDDSGAVVASFGDARLRWHNLPVNAGSQSAPNNAGARLARGQYIAYLGHDDLWHPTHLSTVVEAIERADADLAHGLTVMIGPPGTDARVVAGVRPANAANAPVFVPPSSVLHRRDLIDQIGPWSDPRTISLPVDAEFLQRAWAYRQRFVSSERLTVFKFNATWRPNSYREKRSDEQAAYVRRIQSEPDFLANELLAIVRAYVARTALDDLGMPASTRPGWAFEINRWVRGLEADPPPAAVEELFRLRTREGDLLQLVHERTAWAQSLDSDLRQRDTIIRDLQALVDQQTTWAQTLDREVARRDAIIRDLQALVAERTAWAQDLDRAIQQRDALIRALQGRPAQDAS
jgi:glycosyltransferase involved in cell wall biosynthesis